MSRELRLELDGQPTTVRATAPDAEGRLGWERDGAAVEAIARRVGAGEWQVRLGERAVRVWLARTDEGTWVSWDGRTRLVRADDGNGGRPARSGRGRRAGGRGAGATVTPLTPATVVKVLVEPGTAVEAGAPLVVVSAMKMETTLAAPHAGTVRAVRTSVGARVAPGDVLVDIEPAGPTDGRVG